MEMTSGATDFCRLHSLQCEFYCEATVRFVFFCCPKMASRKRTQGEFYFRIVKEFPDQLQTDKKILFCKVCQVQINAGKKSQVTQHLNTAQHKKLLLDRPSSSQQLLPNMVVSTGESNEPQYVKNSFNVELCHAFVSGSYLILLFVTRLFFNFIVWIVYS